MQARTGGAPGARASDRGGGDDQGRRGGPGCGAGDRAPLVAALAGRERGRVPLARVPAHALLAAAELPLVALDGGRAADPARPRADQLRARPPAGTRGPAPLDDLEGAP